jgi:hypothetical protein
MRLHSSSSVDHIKQEDLRRLRGTHTMVPRERAEVTINK